MEEKRYVVVTPAKNEETFLPKVAEAMIRQTILPKIWLIVNDGSTDQTKDIISSLTSKYDWIYSITLGEHPRDLFYHYSFVCINGFDAIQNIAKEKNIEYDYIALNDADTVVSNCYYELLIKELDAEPKLGLISGILYNIIDGDLVNIDNFTDPRGSGRMWTRECFKKTNGYELYPAPDTISIIRCKNKGYYTKINYSIKAIQLRFTSEGDNKLKISYNYGYYDYFYNIYFINALYKSIFVRAIRKPYVINGFAYLSGYISSFLHRTKKIDDLEIQTYFRDGFKNHAIKKIKKMFNKHTYCLNKRVK